MQNTPQTAPQLNLDFKKNYLDKGRLSDKRIKLKSFVKFKMKW
ncbi:hypothetical protein CAMRE0001_0979 [Campylobacter rectus RM3267]|uniref:Uncharacterized protein n=1 Tax=Campylobacter rectus RM3267 TaxID=553218 RepID=B9D2P1_CAMRE|nr:hypothetical protein CAMRE0001_0979 [Campylobacter rectus RM3267]